MDLHALLQGNITSTTLLDAVIYSALMLTNPLVAFVSTSVNPGFKTVEQRAFASSLVNSAFKTLEQRAFVSSAEKPGFKLILQ
jgi:hypothetical protein